MERNNIFINLSNHPSNKWSINQINESLKYGNIIDMSFPSIDPINDNINELVDKYYKEIININPSAIMLQGEMVFTYRLVSKLKEANFLVLASCSIRETKEIVKDNETIKTAVFNFVKYREY